MIARTEPTSLVNLTPHSVVVRVGDVDREFPSRGVARIDDDVAAAGALGGIPLVDVHPGSVVGLPDRCDGVVLIVSRVLAAAMPARPDLVFPFREIRDASGRIVAVSALARFAAPGGQVS